VRGGFVGCPCRTLDGYSSILFVLVDYLYCPTLSVIVLSHPQKYFWISADRTLEFQSMSTLFLQASRSVTYMPDSCLKIRPMRLYAQIGPQVSTMNFIQSLRVVLQYSLT
jgi:hypothetical protein